MAEEGVRTQLLGEFDVLKVNSADEIINHELPSFIRLAVQRHEGETREGQFHGEGLAYFEGGHMYKGMFSNGLMDGRGVFTCAGGLKYEGDFVCNHPLGKGTYTWPDGSSYKGDIYYSMRHGTGAYTCAKNGMSYSGQWDQSKRHGKGEVYYNHEKTSWYKGDWVKNNREGFGVRCYPSGNIYSGEWRNNFRCGEGTMKWLKEGEEYVGTWKDGVQHGRGTHTWLKRRGDESQYSLSNRYTGDFVQGQRHGRGTFYYANGAVYDGEWRNNKKHGRAKFTYKDGRVFEGEFVNDQMMTDNLNGQRLATPFCGSDSSVLGPSMALNINFLLEKVPEKNRDSEREQVEFVVLRQASELRSIYSFYSRLGQAHSPDNTFMLTCLQVWRLLKDCNIHHHGITLTKIDHFIKDVPAAEKHSPFTPVLLRELLRCLVAVSYHIYHKDMMPQRNLLAACFSKLMMENILPNAKNVKGFLFRNQDCAVVAMNYVKKSWEIYQTYCKVSGAHKDEEAMTFRHMLWLFKDLHLLDSNMTVVKLLQIITSESCDPNNLSSCLDVEITFLEFFEVLLGSAEVKYQQVSEELEKTKSLLSPYKDMYGLKASENRTERLTDSAFMQLVKSQQDAETNTGRKPRYAGKHGSEEVKQTRRFSDPYHKQEPWTQTIHQFFNQLFFPAYEHFQSVSKNMRETLQRESQRHMTILNKAESQLKR